MAKKKRLQTLFDFFQKRISTIVDRDLSQAQIESIKECKYCGKIKCQYYRDEGISQ